MEFVLKEVSTITEKGQTTIPKSIRRALGVDRGGKIAFRVTDEGVSVLRADADHEDPAVDAFLAFLGSDLRARPHAISPVSPNIAQRMADLTADAAVDLDAHIEGDVAL